MFVSISEYVIIESVLLNDSNVYKTGDSLSSVFHLKRTQQYNFNFGKQNTLKDCKGSANNIPDWAA